MVYVYFFTKCVVRWSENSVRFEKCYGNWLLVQMGKDDIDEEERDDPPDWEKMKVGLYF